MGIEGCLIEKSMEINSENLAMSIQPLDECKTQSTWVIIDATVENSEALIHGVTDSSTVFILDHERDGIEQITELLQAATLPPESLHIISHGSPGTLYLGHSELSLSTLTSYAQQLKTWAVSDLLLYGCNVAAGDAGAEFTARLHHLTGANIAASTSKVGHARWGANWDLDVNVGIVEASIAFTADITESYTGVLMFVDLTSWEQQGNLANGNWTVSGSTNETVVQSGNLDPTYYVSSSNFINGTVTGTFRVNAATTGQFDDDDFIGFVFGYQGPVSDLGNQPDDYDFYLFDWKQSEQTRDDFNVPNLTSFEGFSLSRVQASTGNTLLEDGVFFSRATTTGFQVLDTDYGAGKGWADDTTYDFELVYNTDRVTISIDGTTIFDIAGTFEAGRFGFYNYSQAGVEYSQFTSVGAPPTATADAYTVTPTTGSTPFDTPGEGILANDSSGTLNPLSAVLVSTTSNGTLSLNSDGSFEYTPNAGFLGVDSFTYQATDGSASSSVTTATITVTDSIPTPSPFFCSQYIEPNVPLVFQFEQYVQFEEIDEMRPYQGGSNAPLDRQIGGLRMASLYDETYYLCNNPDVAEAVANGDFTYGYEHFLLFGIDEGRNPSYYYDEELYLNTYTDVRAAVDNGSLSSGLEHYLIHGHIENRTASELFDPNDYLLQNTDVANAVAAGGFTSGFHHYLEFGAEEGRISTLLFEQNYYLEQNPDIQPAINSGNFQSAFEHYIYFGQQEARDPGPLFDESAYQSPDVAAAIGSGQFSSGMEHFFRFGRSEGRAVTAAV